jgi:hypothetical protein
MLHDSGQASAQIEVTPAMVEAAAMVLWDYVGDGVTQGPSLTELEIVVRKLLVVAVGSKALVKFVI